MYIWATCAYADISVSLDTKRHKTFHHGQPHNRVSLIYDFMVAAFVWITYFLRYNLGDNTFVIEWFAGINWIILRSQI